MTSENNNQQELLRPHPPSFHFRPLPESCVPFSSTQGKHLFKASLASGHAETYFPLASTFATQSDPAYCGLTTLAMILNALHVDPMRPWKGVWRWWSEEMLDCCRPLDDIQRHGITFSEFTCLARCNGLHAEAVYASHADCDSFRRVLVACVQEEDGGRLPVVAYARDVLAQTGSGHFSPIGAYHVESDRVLVLDVARFKYPSYWVPLPLLWQAMQPLDPETNKSRGYILLQRPPTTTSACPSYFDLHLSKSMWSLLSKRCTAALEAKEQVTFGEWVRLLWQAVPVHEGFMRLRPGAAFPFHELRLLSLIQDALQMASDVSDKDRAEHEQYVCHFAVFVYVATRLMLDGCKVRLDTLLEGLIEESDVYESDMQEKGEAIVHKEIEVLRMQVQSLMRCCAEEAGCLNCDCF